MELASDASGWSSARYRHEIGDVSVVLRGVNVGPISMAMSAAQDLDRLSNGEWLSEENLALRSGVHVSYTNGRASAGPLSGSEEVDVDAVKINLADPQNKD